MIASDAATRLAAASDDLTELLTRLAGRDGGHRLQIRGPGAVGEIEVGHGLVLGARYRAGAVQLEGMEALAALSRLGTQGAVVIPVRALRLGNILRRPSELRGEPDSAFDAMDTLEVSTELALDDPPVPATRPGVAAPSERHVPTMVLGAVRTRRRHRRTTRWAAVAAFVMTLAAGLGGTLAFGLWQAHDPPAPAPIEAGPRLVRP